LDVDKTYALFITYDGGLQRSECIYTSPIITQSLSEYFGEKEAKNVDLRCFIATAAFGSPWRTELKELRWFRDNILLKNSLGHYAVEIYYTYSPYWAAQLESYPRAKPFVRYALIGPVALISLWHHHTWFFIVLLGLNLATATMLWRYRKSY
jgi:hypothetical protein